jgi:TrpR family trp operon transcriptional repressor
METNEEGWWQFIHLCQTLKTKQDLNGFFDLILTLEEKSAISDRIKIIHELVKESRTQREIATHCQVSIAKITRGSNSLKLISEKLRKFLKRELK